MISRIPVITLQGHGLEAGRRRIVEVVSETELGWEAIPVDNRCGILPWPRYIWTEVQEPQKARAAK